MGDGGYSQQNRATRTVAYMNNSIGQNFQQRETHRDMASVDVKIRESRDSAEHPNSKAIIIAFDETGSMGKAPHEMIGKGLPVIMGKILESGIEDPQLIFLGIGDHKSDSAPLQIGQFESSDEKIDHWLEKIYLEGNGGGNGGESYMLAWYFAARHTSIDCWEKRKDKGLLITIGDEPVHGSISGYSLLRIMGKGEFEEEYSSVALLHEAMDTYEVHHINLLDHSGMSPRVRGQWDELLGQNAHHVESVEDISLKISEIILKKYKDTIKIASHSSAAPKIDLPKQEDKSQEILS